jgi:hypothetical protein
MTQMEKLNECARMFYVGMGYEVEKGYDFQSASHPQKRLCFVMAIRSFNFWKKEIKKDRAGKDGRETGGSKSKPITSR